MSPSFAMLPFCPGSLFLDRDEESISLLKAQALEVGPWYDYSKIVAFVYHFDF
jgi:hypothetical protein